MVEKICWILKGPDWITSGSLCVILPADPQQSWSLDSAPQTTTVQKLKPQIFTLNHKNQSGFAKMSVLAADETYKNQKASAIPHFAKSV